MAYTPDSLTITNWQSPISITGTDLVSNLDEAINDIIDLDANSLKAHTNAELAKIPPYLSNEFTKIYTGVETLEASASVSATNAKTSETNAANSAASVNANNIVHTAGSGLPNEVGVVAARVNGDSTKTFKVANATTNTEAPNLGQAWNTLDGKVIHLPQDTNLETWADSVPNSGLYDLSLTVAQGALPAGWWYIEYFRHYNDTSTNLWHFIRATSFGAGGNVLNQTYINTRNFGPWSGWKKIWNEANDGVGSGLDADLVRGLPADFTSSKAYNGYQKLPSGLIIQWGHIARSTSTAAISVTFPVAFPTSILTVYISTDSVGGTDTRVSRTRARSVTGFQSVIDSWSSTYDSAYSEFWIAIGY